MQNKYAQYFSPRKRNHRLNNLCTTHEDQNILNADKSQSNALPGERSGKHGSKILFVSNSDQESPSYSGQWRPVNLIMINVEYRTVISEKNRRP